MRNSDENQNKGASTGRRVYKKQNIDDHTVVRKKNVDDYDLGKDDAYIPGLEDIDHFDFDDSDVERYRKINEKQAAERAQKKSMKRDVKRKEPARTQKGRRSKRKTAVTQDGPPPDSGMTVFSVADKKRTNKEILRVTYLMMLLFCGMIGYFIYFNVVLSPGIVNNVHNSRLAKLADKTQRGTIYSADGEVLAKTTIDEDGSQQREYPFDNVFAHVVGTYSINKSGIELSADSQLITSNVQPLEKAYNEILGQRNPGNNVTTSLESSLQQAAYDALGDRDGAVVAIEPSTGKVLAMVSKPDYNPNTLDSEYESILSDTSSKVLLNQATQGLFVPGSIFKIVTTLAYLRSGADVDAYAYYCSGSISLSTNDGTSSLRCYDGEAHGEVDLKESFAESCNSSFANIGLSLSVSELTKTAESLLFNTSLPGEFTTSVSKFTLSDTDSDWQVGATAIGQGHTVTSPLHAAMVVSAIANGGNLMAPYVIDTITDAKGVTVDVTKPLSAGSLMTESEASTLTDMMKAVIDEGTGYKLSGFSYDIAGKTGTAEVSGSGNNAWFVGFAPADDPKIAICVLVEDAGTASSEAVPIAGEVFDAYLIK